LFLLRRKLGYLNGAQFYSGAWRMLLSAVLMAGILRVLLSQFDEDAVWLQMILGASVGGMVYFLGCLLLGVKEPQRFLAFGRDWLSKRR